MPLTLEDASGRADADSYAGRDTFLSYLESHGLAVPEGSSDAEIDAALRRGTQAVDLLFGARWLGRRLLPTQALDFPRVGIVVDGARLAPNPLPRALVYATCEAAYREAGAPGALLPDFDPAAIVTSESVGQISVSYADPSAAQQAGQGVTFTVIERLLQRLTSGGPSGGLVGARYLLRG